MGLCISCLEPESLSLDVGGLLNLSDLKPDSIYYVLLVLPAKYSMPHLKELNVRIDVLSGGVNNIHMSQKERMPSRFRKHWDSSDVTFIVAAKMNDGLKNQHANINSQAKITPGNSIVFPMTAQDLGMNSDQICDIVQLKPGDRIEDFTDIVEDTPMIQTPHLNMVETTPSGPTRRKESSFYFSNRFNSTNSEFERDEMKMEIPSSPSFDALSPNDRIGNLNDVVAYLKAPQYYYISIQTPPESSHAELTHVKISTFYYKRGTGPREPAESIILKEKIKADAEELEKLKRMEKIQQERQNAIDEMNRQAAEARKEKERIETLERNRIEEERQKLLEKEREAYVAAEKLRLSLPSRKAQFQELIVSNEIQKFRNTLRPKSQIEIAVSSKMNELVQYAESSLETKENMRVVPRKNSSMTSEFSLSSIAENPDLYFNYRTQMAQLEQEKVSQYYLTGVYPTSAVTSNQVARLPSKLPPITRNSSSY